MKLLIAGDFFVNQNSKFDIKSLEKRIVESDYFLFNLEAPIVESKSIKPALKGGPNLSMDNKTLMPFDAYADKLILSGANNHMGDFGDEGVLSTLDFFKKNRIKNIGCGENLEEASKALFLEDNVVLLAIAENEFGMARENRAGANPLNIEKHLIEIMNLEKEGYLVLVYFHGGTERLPIPNPFIKRLYKSFVDAGAKMIIGNHTHTPQAYECYNGINIFYSLGNFIFDDREVKQSFKNKMKQKLREKIKGKIIPSKNFWNLGYMLAIKIEDNKIDFEILPVQYIDKKLLLLEKKEKENFMSYLEGFSEISQEEYLALWNAWTYYQSNFIQRKVSSFSYSELEKKYKDFLSFRNQITCESHRELLLNLNFLIENKVLTECSDFSKIAFLQNPDNFNI